MRLCPFTGQPESAALYNDTTSEMVARFNAQRMLYEALADVAITPRDVIDLFVRATRGRKR